MRDTLRHWPEYLMEAAGLGIFMVVACAFGTLLEYRLPVRQTITITTMGLGHFMTLDP